MLERGAGEFILGEDFERRVCDGVEGTSDGWGWDLRDVALVLRAVCGVGGSGRRESRKYSIVSARVRILGVVLLSGGIGI